MFNKFKQNLVVKLDQEEVPLESMTLVSNNSTLQSSQSRQLSQKPSIISEGTSFEGNMVFNGILHLDGKFKGNIKADKIIIGKNGSFKGKFEADAVIIFGDLQGEVDCRSLTLNTGSTVSGKINYCSIRVELGSSVEGELNCVYA